MEHVQSALKKVSTKSAITESSSNLQMNAKHNNVSSEQKPKTVYKEHDVLKTPVSKILNRPEDLGLKTSNLTPTSKVKVISKPRKKAAYY